MESLNNSIHEKSFASQQETDEVEPNETPGTNPKTKPEVEPDALPEEDPGIQPGTHPGKEDDDDDDDPFSEPEIGDDPDEIGKKTTIFAGNESFNF